jgi:ribosomal protein S18 acetylase RimI-like enzyme
MPVMMAFMRAERHRCLLGFERGRPHHRAGGTVSQAAGAAGLYSEKGGGPGEVSLQQRPRIAQNPLTPESRRSILHESDEAEALQLRRYTEADAAAVWALHNNSVNLLEGYGDNGTSDEDLRNIAEVYLDAGGEFLVGEADGKLVAMGALVRTGPASGEIKRMRVERNYRRQGFGSRILAELEARARELGYRRLRLDTTTDQTAAQALYQERGFTKIGTGRMGRFEIVIFEKRLDPPER